MKSSKLRESINKAFLLLKREIYYEKIDLYQRENIAIFEDDNFQIELENIHYFLTNKNINSEWFVNHLNSINSKFLPKKIKYTLENNGINFISNLRSLDDYEVEEINYFFNGSFSLYILSALWSIFVGPLLDQSLVDDCYGNRLEINEENKIIGEHRIFKLYLNQYNKWRDGAIQAGLDSLEKNIDVLLIALDFKHCFYNLSVNWTSIKELIESNNSLNKNEKDIFIFLTEALKVIHQSYFNKNETFLRFTHSNPITYDVINGIPVGLPSSRVLSNWCLSPIDKKIKNELRPIFYGRYVDDVLIVLNNPDEETVKKGPKAILEKYFIDVGIFKEYRNVDKNKKPDNNEDSVYKVGDYEQLIIQNSKIIIHYYDHNHSWAGLNEFKEELRLKVSEFRFLPEEDQYKDLVDEAYDIQFNGSIYKFRSVIGISENATKLSHYLYKQQLKFWLCNEKLRDKTIDELFRFYRGKNIFDYCKLWERIFTLFIISKNFNEFYKFYLRLNETIEKINFPASQEIQKKIRFDCLSYMNIAISMAIGYLGYSIKRNNVSIRFYNLLKKLYGKPIQENNLELFINDNYLPNKFRKNLLLRHQNISWPLLEYTNFEENLCEFNFQTLLKAKNKIKINSQKLKNSSRFVHLDELLLFEYLFKLINIPEKTIIQDSSFSIFEKFEQFESKNFLDDDLDSIDEFIKKISFQNVSFKKLDCKSSFPIKHSYKISDKQKNKIFNIGIVNLKVNTADIEASYNPLKKPNTSYKRQTTLFELINIGINEPKCDLMIFPEVSIPFAWLPFMVKQSRRSNIGLIFGLEHIVHEPYALNLVATLLPFRNENGFHNVFISLRLKNHYSPSELHKLNILDLTRPPYKFLYEKFSWRNTVFPVYNCYELTDIQHRSLFRSEIDLLIAVEYNQDINYFSNILEAATRDIHCYSAQANSSDYGDSRVISPKRTEEMNIIRLKGGENAVLVKTFLDINSLRSFQVRKFSPGHNEFKPTPAGYDPNNARNRN